jgi:hypothetical protein
LKKRANLVISTTFENRNENGLEGGGGFIFFFPGGEGWLVGGEPEGFDLIDGTVGGI